MLSLLPGACATPSIINIHGVDPLDQGKYLSSGFSCPIGGKASNLPINRVNDEFCDCDDGQDEPGTSACSHLVSAHFYCKNEGFFPEKIPTSRVEDGICDCCDGSDEAAGENSPCINTCEIAAKKFKIEAEKWLEVVTEGFQKRQKKIDNEITAYFAEQEKLNKIVEKDLVELKLLKERVAVHKDREELKEVKYRMEIARQKHMASRSGEETTNLDTMAAEQVDFEELDAVRVADDEDLMEDELPSDVLNGKSNILKSLIELPDGSQMSLVDYLRMDHNQQAKTQKRSRRTVEEMRRDDGLGPLFNGDAEGRKKLGIYALRTIGIAISPVRGFFEVLFYMPKFLWSLLSTSTIISSVISKLPDFPSPTRSVWFRQLGDGSVYASYRWIKWGAWVIWDTPVYAYHYLFPTLDEDIKLPVAESLRKIMGEIDSNIANLEKEQREKREITQLDYGTDRAFFAMRDQCIKKRIEKYDYEVCGFQEIKQDRTRLGKWDGWAMDESNRTLYTKMLYSKGQKCYNGPERSAVVNLECGSEDEIVRVDEPSTCVYEITIRTPLACTAQVLTKAQEDVLFWTRSSK